MILKSYCNRKLPVLKDHTLPAEESIFPCKYDQESVLGTRTFYKSMGETEVL